MEKLFVNMYRHIICKFLSYIQENSVDNDIRKIKSEIGFTCLCVKKIK